jgi:hypothetical protein
LDEISGVDRPAQPPALAVIMKSFNASGEGPTHRRLAALYDNARRANPHIPGDAAFALAWAELSDDERDAIRAEEASTAREREAENAARRNAMKGVAEMQYQDVDIGGLAMFGLQCAAAEYRKAHPDLSEAQAFAKVYTDPTLSEIARIEREASRRRIASYSAARVEPDALKSVAKRDDALAELRSRAAEYRKARPELTKEQAFAKVYQDPANKELAARERSAAREALYG